MSKLSNHQIAAMIQGLEAAHGLGYPTAERYRRELAERLGCTPDEAVHRLADSEHRNAQVGRSDSSNDLCFQQTQSIKAPNLGVLKEGRMEKKDALAAAGEQIEADLQTSVEIATWIGRLQGFALVANKCSAAQADILKRLKDTSAHKAFGMTREEFCDRQIGIPRQTCDRIISNYEEFGAAYFAMSNVMRISPQTYRLLGTAVTDANELVFGDEKIPITKANADRIAEAVAAIRKEAEQAAQQVYDAKSDLKKARAERDNAKKAAEKARQELIDRDKQAELAWANADEDHRFLIKLEIDRDFLLQRLRSFAEGRQLSPENQDRLVAFCEATWAEVHQATEKIRGWYGVGLLRPTGTTEVDELTPNKRSLIDEYNATNPLGTN